MLDPYAMLLQMVAEGRSDEEVAQVTGWPLDAVTTMREEIECQQRGDCP